MIGNASGIVNRIGIFKLVRHTFNGGNNALHISGRSSGNLDRIKSTIQNVLRKQILHGLELIIISRRIHRFNNLSNQVGNLVPRQESKAKVILLNSGLVEFLVIHHVESRTNVRNLTLENLVFSNSRVITERLSNVHIDFFNRFTKVKESALKNSPRISIKFGVNDCKTNAIHKCVQKFVLECIVSHDDSTNFTDGILRRVSNRNIVLIVGTSGVTNSVENINIIRG